MKRCWTGKESAGKNYILADESEYVIRRNTRWLKRTGVPRTMAYDAPMSPAFIERIKESGLKYLQFRNLSDILQITDADIFIGELLKFFPQRGSDPLPFEVLDFITQSAKRGVFIYGASQDFSQVHKQYRLLVNEVYIVTKIIGSPRPFPSRPPVKRIWGIIMARAVDPDSFKGDNSSMKELDTVWRIPQFYLIQRKICELFDTSYSVKLGEHPPLYVRKQRIIGNAPDGTIVYEKEVWKP